MQRIFILIKRVYYLFPGERWRGGGLPVAEVKICVSEVAYKPCAHTHRRRK